MCSWCQTGQWILGEQEKNYVAKRFLFCDIRLKNKGFSLLSCSDNRKWSFVTLVFNPLGGIWNLFPTSLKFVGRDPTKS